jgi:hypothetical protein
MVFNVPMYEPILIKIASSMSGMTANIRKSLKNIIHYKGFQRLNAGMAGKEAGKAGAIHELPWREMREKRERREKMKEVRSMQ